MKTLFILTLLTFSVVTPVMAQSQEEKSETMKLKELEKLVNEKEHKSLALITIVGSIATSDDNKKQQAEYAHVGFVARLQGVREDREAFIKNDVPADYMALQDYSKRLDSLNSDLRTFLK